MKDGKPFRFVAGSFHYFRAQPQRWRDKLRAFRAAGLNAVTTYVEWFTHNPYDGQFVWDGIANVEEFIRLAAEEDLLVILRPGPYICAEREFVSSFLFLIRVTNSIARHITHNCNNFSGWISTLALFKISKH